MCNINNNYYYLSHFGDEFINYFWVFIRNAGRQIPIFLIYD